MADKEFLSRKEAASHLHSMGCPLSPRALELLACNNNAKRGPPYTRWRNRVIYRRSELIEWAIKEMVRVA